jgi:anti-sigma regulatory factor (Ser/Thr protein kinase)
LNNQLRFEVSEASQVAEARRAAGALTRQLGLTEVEVGQVAIAITEAATNLVKHAQQGELLVRAFDDEAGTGLELIALDRGPGIADLPQSLRDGFSTAGSPGTGLGALSRVADEFDIYSLPGKGTILRAVLWSRASTTRKAPATLQFGVICQPKAGEEVSGDDWGVAAFRHKYALVVADGLGHGPDAHKAARAATDTLRRDPSVGPGNLLEAIHAASRGTRGAAVAVCELDSEQRLCRFAGVGNINAAVIENSNTRHLVSHNGIVGHSVRKIQEFSAPWSDSALLVLHSDGVATQWNLDLYPGLLARHPALIAAVLYRDYSRQRDDATVLVAKPARASA